MSVRIMIGDCREPDSEGCVLYCSTSGWAFGPVFDNYEQAEQFLHYVGVDPRVLTEKQLADKYSEFQSATVECTVCWRDIPWMEYYTEHIDSHPCE